MSSGFTQRLAITARSQFSAIRSKALVTATPKNPEQDAKSAGTNYAIMSVRMKRFSLHGYVDAALYLGHLVTLEDNKV